MSVKCETNVKVSSYQSLIAIRSIIFYLPEMTRVDLLTSKYRLILSQTSNLERNAPISKKG